MNVWGVNNTENLDVNIAVDRTTGVVTNVVPNLSTTTIALDLTGTAARSSGALNNKMFHVANTVACHIVSGSSSVDAVVTNTLLMPGERLLVLPAQYVSVIKATGVSDGIIRLTECN